MFVFVESVVTSAFILSFLALTYANNIDFMNEWKLFKKTFNKSYSPTEEESRREIWLESVRHITSHNIMADFGYHSYRRGLSRYSDLSFEEFSENYLSSVDSVEGEMTSEGLGNPWVHHPNPHELPTEVNWKHRGFVTNVKTQGKCGACWAFAATGSLEGQHKRLTGSLVSLSEQNLIDCAADNFGCAGGWMENAYNYVCRNGGIDTEIAYPYEEKNGTCHFERSKIGARCRGYVTLPSGDEKALQAAVATVGPVSATVDFDHDSIFHYKSGIYYNSSCKADVFNHAVLVVGYGAEDGIDYWLAKNSWGSSWGMNGYIKLMRNNSNLCGIASKASYPLM